MDLSQDIELSWDFADVSMDLDLDVVCCVCYNDVGLFDEVLVSHCCMNNAHRTCSLSGEAAAWSCISCDWTDGSDQSEESAVTSNQGEINLNKEGKLMD